MVMALMVEIAVLVLMLKQMVAKVVSMGRVTELEVEMAGDILSFLVICGLVMIDGR